MNRAGNILMTLVVVAATVLAIYAMYMNVPKDDDLYKEYAYKHQLYVAVASICVLLAYYLNAQTRVIKSCLILQAGLYCVVALKCLLRSVGGHNDYDNTIFGCFIIYAAVYVGSPYIKPIITTIQMRWATRHKKKNHGC